MRFLTSLFVSAAFCATASAAPWSDPTQTLKLDTPAGWQAAAAPSDGLTYVVASSAASECHIIGVPREDTAEASPAVIRFAATEEMNRRAWMSLTEAMPQFFPARATLRAHSVDTTGFWPVQRAEFDVEAGSPVFAAIQLRPGIEIWALCMGGAADTAALYDQLFSSIGTPIDASLQERALADTASLEEHRRQARAFAISERRIMRPVHARDDDGYIPDGRGRTPD